GRRLAGVELVPHDQAGLLEHVVGVGAVGQERQDVGVEAPLVLEEQAEEQPVLLGGAVAGPIRRWGHRARAEAGAHAHWRNTCGEMGSADAGAERVTYLVDTIRRIGSEKLFRDWGIKPLGLW